MPKSVAGVLREFKQGHLHSGSSTGRTVTNPKQAVAIALSEQRQKRVLHPKMAQRAHLVKEAHAHLAKHSPGFSQLHPTHRMRAVQAHITRSLKGR